VWGGGGPSLPLVLGCGGPGCGQWQLRGPSSPWVWGGGEPSFPLVLGCGGSSPRVRGLVDPVALVTWPSNGVSWRSWAVAAIDMGPGCCGCGVSVCKFSSVRFFAPKTGNRGPQPV
jgi:hypothetical protein